MVVPDPLTGVRAISWPRCESAPRIRVSPHWGFSTTIRTTSAATSRRVIGRPRPRRALPASVWAINLRYQRRIVSGVTMPATCITTRRPSCWPRTASRRRWASVRRSGRGPRCSRRTRLPAAAGRSRNTTLAHASPETTDAESAQPLGVEPRLGPVRARVGPRPPAPSPRVPRSRAGPSCGPWRDSRHTNGRWSGLAALTRCRVVRGGGAKRGAGRRGRPRGVAAGLAPPASAALDRQRAGPRRRAVPARG